MLHISKRPRLSPLAEAPPLDSLAEAAAQDSPAPRENPSDGRLVRPKRLRKTRETESLELHFLSCVLSGEPAIPRAKDQYEDPHAYFSAMSAMILCEAKGMLSEMQTGQKGKKGKRCQTALSTSCHGMMEFDISGILDDAETWSVFLAESRDNPIFRVVVRRGATGDVGVMAQGNWTTDSDFDAWLYPSTVFLGDLWRQWEACKSVPKTGSLLREILGQTVCSKAEQVQANNFSENHDTGLNVSQVQALDMCLSGARCMHCIQGPPGTGKSKTILSFLDCLARAAGSAGSEDLFVVASMTNKACQLLASNFREAKQTRSIRVALAGNMKKLPTDASYLRNIFVHGRGSHLAEQVYQAEAAKPVSFGKLKDRACHWLGAWAPDTYERAKERLLQASNSSTLRDALQVLDSMLENELLGRAHVLFATLSTLARPHVREQATHYGKRQVKWVIVDEAGQAVEAQMLPVLAHWLPNRALLVGDTNQLTATTSQMGSNAGYGRSLMSRLEKLGMVPHMLNVQYRMLPPISCFPARHFYSSKLHDAGSWDGPDPCTMLSDWVSKKCPMKSESVPAYVYLNLSGTERQAGASWANDQEAEICVDLASSLLRSQRSQRLSEERKGTPQTPKCIIITFYGGQKEALEQLTLQLPPAHRPEVHTVDSFQGSEAEQVVISFVRSNGSGRIGFLSEYRRLNVALTRARRSLFLVGDLTFMKSTDGDLAMLAQDAESRGLVVDAKKVHGCILPEVYALPAVNLVPVEVGEQKLVTLKPGSSNQMSTSQKIDAPLSALI